MTSCAGPGTRDPARAAPIPSARNRSPATQWRGRHLSPALGGRSAATLCAGRKAAVRNEIPRRSRNPASAQPAFAAAPGMHPCQPTRCGCAASIRDDPRTSRSAKPSLRTQGSRALLRDRVEDRPETPAWDGCCGRAPRGHRIRAAPGLQRPPARAAPRAQATGRKTAAPCQRTSLPSDISVGENYKLAPGKTITRRQDAKAAKETKTNNNNKIRKPK